jgi:hypothetical protein
MLTIRNTIQTVAAAGTGSAWLCRSAQAQSAYWAGASQGAYVNVQFNAPPRSAMKPCPLRAAAMSGLLVTGSRGHRHVWRAGHWVQARPGYVYRPARLGAARQPLGLPRQPLGQGW